MYHYWFTSFCFWIFCQIYFKKKKTGGISFNSTVPVTHVDEKRCYQILHEYKIHNAEVLSLCADGIHTFCIGDVQHNHRTNDSIVTDLLLISLLSG